MGRQKLGKEFCNFTVSEGTLKTEDIVDKISLLVQSGEIESQSLDRYIDEYYEELGKENEDQVELDGIYEDIYNLLNFIAPEDCYFGGHPGDGALIGFWVMEEEIEEE